MATNFLKIAVTDSVRNAQKHYFGRSVPLTGAPERDALTGEEISFIQARDSFYIATSQSGALQARIAELEARLKACKV